jgi:hypothetical protein
MQPSYTGPGGPRNAADCPPGTKVNVILCVVTLFSPTAASDEDQTSVVDYSVRVLKRLLAHAPNEQLLGSFGRSVVERYGQAPPDQVATKKSLIFVDRVPSKGDKSCMNTITGNDSTVTIALIENPSGIAMNSGMDSNIGLALSLAHVWEE